MPTYLTPGVYVEEVPSANKPIEGVSTSIAAFVGLAPGGPVNTPMRISNWTQFAKIYGDPSEPDNGPFMDGAYLAHSVYGFFQNGGALCWVVRVGEDGGSNGAGAARAALPAGAAPGAGGPAAAAARGRAGGGRRRPGGLRGRGARGRARRRQRRDRRGPLGRRGRRPDLHGPGDGGRREGGVPRALAQEGPQQPRDEGQRAVEADQDRGDRRVAARGAARPGPRHVPPVGSVDRPHEGQADALRGRRRPAQGHGRPGGGGRDHDGRDARHHDPGVRGRRRRPDPRSPGQDDRPLRERGRPDGDPRLPARHAAPGDPRVADEHRGL